jgi:hypothetical protein
MMESGVLTPAGIEAGDAYVWSAPGHGFPVAIDYDVIDRLGEAIQRGIAAAPRSGLEAGGILLGTVEDGENRTVRVEDFEPVPRARRDGAAYVLGDEDQTRFAEALERWKGGGGRRLRAVGFYRGHTRAGLSLDAKDQELLDRCFPEDTAIALLVKPLATAAARAALFCRQNGRFTAGSSEKEFPFRREELGGATGTKSKESPVNANLITQGYSAAGASGIRLDTSLEQTLGALSRAPEPATDQTVVPKRTLRLRGGWVWIPVSFIFLLLGTVIGFQVALSVQSKVRTDAGTRPYDLQLTATPSADSIHLRWDRNARAIQEARSGVLVIQEDGREKRVDLDAGHLRNGSVIYRRASDSVSFRLDIYLQDDVVVSQRSEFRPVAAR